MTGFPAAQRRRNLRCRSNYYAASARSTKSTGPVWAPSCRSPPRSIMTVLSRSRRHGRPKADIRRRRKFAVQHHQSGHWLLKLYPIRFGIELISILSKRGWR
jgi:hypothetical protein